jgi:8-oxo-dGTP pyrophosphatase MutT (NUDIX family)
VVTASAYVLHRRRFVFAVGFPGAARDRLGIARLGGHREAGETAWACAAREVREESGLTLRQRSPPATYWIGPDENVAALVAGGWAGEPGEGAPPLLVGWRHEGVTRRLSATYLARGAGTPFPAAETQGLLLLRPRDVRRLARERLTLGALLADGGQALLRAPLPPDAPLEPLTQLRVLAVLLERHPELLLEGRRPGHRPAERG